MTNNYIRNRTGDCFCFDDRDPEQIALANMRVRAFSGVVGTLPNGKTVYGNANRAVAWRMARGLIADGYVGTEKISGL